MPKRKTILASGETYHVFNHGVFKREIFLNRKDYERMLDTINFYRFENPPLRLSHYQRLNKQKKERVSKEIEKKNLLIEIYSFSLMTNHFHFLLKQLRENGISIFMKNFQTSYAVYFRKKHNHKGHLFESGFKAKRVEDDAQFIHLSRYIHLNPYSSYLVKTVEELKEYKWSSFFDYLGKRSLKFLKKENILACFKSEDKYKKFVLDQADYQRKLERIKHLLIE